jgi:hypothetical protein
VDQSLKKSCTLGRIYSFYSAISHFRKVSPGGEWSEFHPLLSPVGGNGSGQNAEKGLRSGEWSLSSGPSVGCMVGVSFALAGKTSGWSSGRSTERPYSWTPLQYSPKSQFVSTVRRGASL